jgi:hypothetical protein
MVSSVLRTFYKGFDLLGSVLIGIGVRYSKEKEPLPPIGNRTLLRESVTAIAEKVSQGLFSPPELIIVFPQTH